MKLLSGLLSAALTFIPALVRAQIPQELEVRSNGEDVYIWEHPLYLALFIAFILLMAGYYLYRRRVVKKQRENDKKSEE